MMYMSPHSSRHVGPTPRATLIALSAALVLAMAIDLTSAEPQWIEMKSAHFRVLSNAGEGSTRTLTWQFEQIRSVIANVWPWARVDPSTPIAVIAVRDEHSLRALAPQFWEGKADVRPASIWASGADQHYIAIRADLRADDRSTLNPYITAYHSYVGLVLQSAVEPNLPLWLVHGLAGVLSNTIVRDNFILVGPPIPWHLERLNTLPRLPLADLLAVTHTSREYTDADRLNRFEAQSWAFVHYLMFGDEGVHRKQVDQFVDLIHRGTAPTVAFKEAFGSIQEYENALNSHIHKTLFPYVKAALDVSVKREAFEYRPMAVAETAAARAAFHVAADRPVDARTGIAQARKADANDPVSYVSEGLLLDREGKTDEAKAAYANAVERGTRNYYAYYRLAQLEWQADPDRDTLLKLEKHLTRAVELNDRLAGGHAYLADVKATLDPKSDAAVASARRAIALEPAEPEHHLSAARVSWRRGDFDDARREAQKALSLARSDRERDAAQRMLTAIDGAAKPKGA
jgi:hypothetical protein